MDRGLKEKRRISTDEHLILNVGKEISCKSAALVFHSVSTNRQDGKNFVCFSGHGYYPVCLFR